MKSGSHFHFKQFSVAHDRCTHKVGTDGVLLGAWVNVEGTNRILDIGTGSGVIALMLAQRTATKTKIDAVEVIQEDAEQAKENVAQSPWKEKVLVHHTSIQNFSPDGKYDLIVSNPPFFINSQKPPEPRRGFARHTENLSFRELLEATKRLLDPEGRLAVVLPYEEGLQFIELAAGFGFYCRRQWAFKSRAHKPIERWLLEFGFQGGKTEEGEILLYKNDTQWSDEYCELTRDFYLRI